MVGYKMCYRVSLIQPASWWKKRVGGEAFEPQKERQEQCTELRDRKGVSTETESQVDRVGCLGCISAPQTHKHVHTYTPYMQQKEQENDNEKEDEKREEQKEKKEDAK